MKVRIINLQSSDNEIHPVPFDVVKCSTTIKTMVLELGLGEDEDDVVPIPSVNSEILSKVIEWATYHKDDPEPAEENQNGGCRTIIISNWDANFLDVDQSILFGLLLAAHYLDIKGLSDVACQTVANMIKGKTPEQVRATFNMVNDFTPEEEEEIRREVWHENN